MCGIVGYVGGQQAAPLLLEGLGRLEHRGYDSAGIAVLGQPRARARAPRCGWPRRPAGCATWPSRCPSGCRGEVGIGHTRWATHGPANDVNAHPHTDAKAATVAVVHNGILDNAAALRAELTEAGVELVSDTDTEVIAHLVARSDGETLEEKVSDALSRIEGTYGLAVLHVDFPDRIVVARNGSPLIIGVGDKEMHVASDLAALVRYTTTVVHLDDGELATVTATGYTTYREDLTDPAQPPRRSTSTRRRTTPGDHDSLHAQGDARAAGGGRAGAARPARRAVRDLAPRRPGDGRPRPARDQAGQGARLRVGVLRRPDGRDARRGAGPDPRGRRGGQRVPLPQPDHRPGHALRRGQPVRRDHRHPAGGAGDPPQGRPGHRPGQRRRQRDRPRVRRRHLPARRARRSRSPRRRR